MTPKKPVMGQDYLAEPLEEDCLEPNPKPKKAPAKTESLGQTHMRIGKLLTEMNERERSVLLYLLTRDVQLQINLIEHVITLQGYGRLINFELNGALRRAAQDLYMRDRIASTPDQPLSEWNDLIKTLGLAHLSATTTRDRMLEDKN